METYVIKFPNGAYASWGFASRVEISELPSEPYVVRVASFEDMKRHIEVWDYVPEYYLDCVRTCATRYLQDKGEEYRDWYNLCMGAEIVLASTLKCTQYDVYDCNGDYCATYLSERTAIDFAEEDEPRTVVAREYQEEGV